MDRKSAKKCLSGCGSCLGCGEGRHRSPKERIRTRQVTDKEQSTNVCVTDIITDTTNMYSIRNGQNIR